MEYRKKPVVIEAFKYGIDNRPDWFNDKVTSNEIITYVGTDIRDSSEYYCEIKTLEGIMRGNCGDYIIKGVQGEIYPCKPDIFEMTYELASISHKTKTKEMKYTAVDWFSNQSYELFEQYSEGKFDRITLNKLMLEATDKAKEMEKEQIIKAFDEGQEYEYQYHINSAPKFYSETYYQETYKKD